MEQATRRRLADELNIESQLEFVYKFSYQASYGELGSEHELCWVYLGRCDATVALNKTEVAESRYVAADALAKELAASPLQFTPWFRLEWEHLTTAYGARLEAYTAGR